MNNLPRQLIRSKTLLTAVCIALANATQAQSLDEQYADFLGGNCFDLGFARDANDIILSGQAGPRLKAKCDGPAPVGGILNFGATGTSGVGVDVGTADDSVRRRREAAKDQKSSSNNGTQDFSIGQGSASAFLSLRYATEEQDATRFEGERESDSIAATLGADYRFGSKGLIGLAVRFEQVSGDLTRGGDFESQAHGFSLYASLYPADSAFIDLSINRNFHDDETHRVVSLERILTQLNGSQSVSIDIPAATLDSQRGSRNTRAQVQAGFDIASGKFSIGPRLGAYSVQSQFDGYGESGPTPMALVFDAQRESSVRSALGVQASRAFTPTAGVFVLQANFDWLHEFKDNQRVSTARLAEDLRANPTIFAFLNEAPDRNFYSTRFSLLTVFRSGWAGFASVEGLLGHAYQQSAGITLGLRKEL